MGIGNFAKIPNGIGSVEHRMDLLYQGVVDGRISLERWVDVCCTTPARMFGLYGQKGVIAPGADADIVIYDPNGHTSIGVGKTHHMNMDYSAWEGFEIDGHVDTVLSRGTVIIDDGGYLGSKSARPVRQARPLAEPDLMHGLRRRAAERPARLAGRRAGPAGRAATASATSGPSTRTCCGRSRSSSTARSCPPPAG